MKFSDYCNHNQIFTHSIKCGIIKGQQWLIGERVARVMCITELGMVILDTQMFSPSSIIKVGIYNLLNNGKLLVPVIIAPYKQTNDKYHLQIFTKMHDNLMVIGELRRNYDDLFELEKSE